MATAAAHFPAAAGHEAPDRRHEQLRRFLYPSLATTVRKGENRIPLLLPLNYAQQTDSQWVEVDLHAQLILAQVLRIAVLPWYSKLTNDKDLFEEVTNVVSHGLRRAKQALLSPTTEAGGLTRLERFLLVETPSIVQTHYVEVRRAISRARKLYHDDRGDDRDDESAVAVAAARIYLASNPHIAVILGERQAFIDEAYVDVLLIAILQAVLPQDHIGAPTEAVIIMDVVKGLFRGQKRTRGWGAWVVVRILSSLLDSERDSATDPPNVPTPLSPSEVIVDNKKRWSHHRVRLLLALHFISAVLKALFLYMTTFYLDLFSPITVEPKKKSKRRKREADSVPKDHPMDKHWDLLPFLETMVEILHWKQRLLTRIVEEWLRLALAWGGNWLIERHAKETIAGNTSPEELILVLERVHSILLALPDQPAPETAREPALQQQQQEYQDLISKLLRLAQSKSAIAVLLGRDESMQRRCIENALLPILAPPSLSAALSVTQVANLTTSINMLERIALLLNPALEKRW